MHGNPTLVSISLILWPFLVFHAWSFSLALGFFPFSHGLLQLLGEPIKAKPKAIKTWGALSLQRKESQTMTSIICKKITMHCTQERSPRESVLEVPGNPGHSSQNRKLSLVWEQG